LFTTALVDASARLLERLTSRRTFLQRVAVVGSAMSVSGLDFVLRPGTAYASVCGSGSACASGWTAMCCTINHGVNQCPPGSFAGGWWKADGASLCGGSARYYIDCHPRCHCGCGSGQHFCAERCWDCKPHCAHQGTCDQRRVCHNVFRYGQCNQQIHCSGPVWCRVISCSPPWRWANCSSSSATDNFTVSHNAPCNATSWTPLQARYKAMGSQGSVLGANIGPERDGTRGRVQHFVHGRMYHSDATGTHYARGHVLGKYVAMGESASALHLPTGDTTDNPGGRGSHNTFQRGAIYATGSTGTHAVIGADYDAWNANGGAAGPLGYPVHDTTDDADGVGTITRFEHGGVSASSWGAFAILDPLWATWRGLSGPSGPLGYPIADTVANNDDIGSHNDFADGTVTTSPATGTHAVWGPIFLSWANDYGREAGALGHPLSEVYALDATHDRCDFTGGSLVLDKQSGTVSQV
jgi:hypothetical protein